MTRAAGWKGAKVVITGVFEWVSDRIVARAGRGPA